MSSLLLHGMGASKTPVISTFLNFIQTGGKQIATASLHIDTYALGPIDPTLSATTGIFAFAPFAPRANT